MTKHRAEVALSKDDKYHQVTVTCACGFTKTEELENYIANPIRLGSVTGWIVDRHYSEVRGEG